MEKQKWWGRHELMVVAAHRYCLGRRTYIVSDCVEWLLFNWNKFESTTQDLIIKETTESLEKGWAGDACDIEEWETFLRKIGILNEREKNFRV